MYLLSSYICGWHTGLFDRKLVSVYNMTPNYSLCGVTISTSVAHFCELTKATYQYQHMTYTLTLSARHTQLVWVLLYHYQGVEIDADSIVRDQ